MAKRSQTLITGLLILVILIIIRYAWAYIQSPLAQKPNIREPFKVAPTTAASCGCLAGYVPSKLRKSPLKLFAIPEYGRFIIAINDQTKERYTLNFKTGMCNNQIDTQLAYLPTQIGVSQLLNDFTDRGTLPCEEAKALVQGDIQGDTYFCQSLSDPTKRRDCY